MVTRRCSQRRFLMRPDPDTTNAFLYCLAYAASRTGVGVMFFIACSNHWHGGIIDHDGRLPEFLECFHKLFAKHQNARLGRWENFWASEQTSVVQLVDPDDVVAKAAYAVSNPVKDNLVEAAAHWVGASSWAAHLDGRPLNAFRPRHFFRSDGPMPDELSLSLAPPPRLDGAVFIQMLIEQVRQIERAAARDRARTASRVLGMETVLEQRVGDRPKSREPRRRLSPRIACRNTWRRIEALLRNRDFVRSYRAARTLFLAGADVLFPAGCYWLRRFAGVRCEPSSPAGP
jgi:putative transposase